VKPSREAVAYGFRGVMDCTVKAQEDGVASEMLIELYDVCC